MHSMDASGRSWVVSALGATPTASKDTLAVVNVDQGRTVRAESFALAARNCRLVDSTYPVFYQTPAGAIRRCKFPVFRLFQFQEAEIRNRSGE